MAPNGERLMLVCYLSTTWKINIQIEAHHFDIEIPVHIERDKKSKRSSECLCEKMRAKPSKWKFVDFSHLIQLNEECWRTMAKPFSMNTLKRKCQIRFIRIKSSLTSCKVPRNILNDNVRLLKSRTPTQPIIFLCSIFSSKSGEEGANRKKNRTSNRQQIELRICHTFQWAQESGEP